MKYDSLTRMMERHGGEWIHQVKMCSQCGRLNAFASNGATCTAKADCNGSMYPVAKYVDFGTVDAPAVLEAIEDIEEVAGELPGKQWASSNDLEEIAENLQDAVEQ